MTKEQLINFLKKENYLKSDDLIEAFEQIDRKDFVLKEYQDEAYENYPLPIGFGQTISQPLVVAFMLELLEVKKGEKILEIGTGSGWQTAILAYLTGEDGKVFSLERILELKIFAEKNISKYNFLEKGIVELIHQNGFNGLEEKAPFDKIIVNASAEKIPVALKKQLKINGKLVIPVKNSILVLEKINQVNFLKKEYFGFVFVPLISNETN